MSRQKKSAALARQDARTAALHRLMAAIFEHEEAGQPVPCVDPRRGHLWLSEHHDDQEAAVHGCATCPALDTCRAYVSAFPEPTGVWAGLTDTDRKKTQLTRRTA